MRRKIPGVEKFAVKPDCSRQVEKLLSESLATSIEFNIVDIKTIYTQVYGESLISTFYNLKFTHQIKRPTSKKRTFPSRS